MAEYNYKIQAKQENIKDVLTFLRAKLKRTRESVREAVIAASYEILSNIVLYAYPKGCGDVDIKLSVDSKSITVTFMDKGKPFDPNTVQDREGIEGKMGIFIARNMMDEYDFSYVDSTNISIIKKNR